MDALGKALAQHGWQTAPGKSSSLSALSAQRLIATKAGTEALFHMKQAAVIVKLVVTTRRLPEAAAAAAPAAPAPAAKPPAAAPAAAAAASASKAESLDFYDNGVRGTYNCDGRRVRITGNACELSLEGRCDSVAVMGNANRVRVLAAIGSINVTGNQNTVSWSKAQNPTPPRVSNLGAGSRVDAE
jgi:hypothetical protein